MLRRIVLASALIAAVALPFVPTHQGRVEAYSGCAANTECGWLYFSDAAHTHEVGAHTTNCQGVVLDWGVKVGYSQFISQGCGGGPVE